MVELKDVEKHYGDSRALGPVSFEIPRGSTVGFLGLNGVGKTTLLRILACDLRPTAGEVRVGGVDVLDDPHAVRKQVGYLPESPPVYGDMTVGDYLLFVGHLKGLDGGTARRRVREVEEATSLVHKHDVVIRHLSHGYRQRVGVAQAIIHEPEMLILDEPTNGLDPAGMAEVRQLIKRLGGDHTVLLASHLLNEVEQVCDHVGILSEGRLIAQGPVSELIGRRNLLLVRTTDDARATEILSRCDWVRSVTDHDGALMVAADPHRAEVVSETLADHRVFLREMTTLDTSLEEYFLRVTEQEEVLV
jgi:ABC-2 type transport system ATP-binding protein